MSQENIEIATAALRAAFARPEPDFDAINRLYDADHVLVPVGAGGLEDEARGAAGYQAWRTEVGDVMDPEFQVEGAVDIGSDKVLAVISSHFSGTSSGVSMDQRMWLVVTLSAGKVTRTEAYGDPSEALEAAGLSE